MGDDTNSPCLTAALAYATHPQRPLYVFPCPPGDKKSYYSKKFDPDDKRWGATNDPDRIKRYWKEKPDANVCIVTGDINGLFVLETDSAAHGKDGEAELKKLIAANGGEWPATLTAQSPSGSIHYYFTWPDSDVDIPNSDSKLAPGIDVRGTGGMVVAPPSFNPKYDGRYEWISPKEQGIVNAPDWLIRLVAAKPVERKVGEPQAPIDKIAYAMELIPNDKPNMAWEVTDYKTGEINTRVAWEGFNTIFMALFRATGGSDAGYSIADKWSRKNKTKYNEKYTHHTWYRRYRTSPPKSVGARTLFTIAETYSPGWEKQWDYEHAQEIIEAKVEAGKKTGKYEIKLNQSNTNNLYELQDMLIAIGLPFYVYGNKLMRPISSDIEAMQGRMTKVSKLIDVTPQYLKVKAHEHITFLKYDARSKKWLPTKPPMDLIQDLLSLTGEWKFPSIIGMISTPTLRRDGTILSQSGFDPATRLLMRNPPDVTMPDKSSRDDAVEAIELLEELLIEFEFTSDVAKSVALSAMITPVVRAAFMAAPMHVNKAPEAANGKSYLFDIVAAIAMGQRMPVIAAGANNEETEKRLGAVLMAGRQLINIDNVDGELGSEALCQYLERPVVDIRILGKSEIKTIEANCTTALFATGNNIVLVGAMTRRVLLCTLDRNEYLPEFHQYKNDPVRTVLGDRAKYIAACLTICRAYQQAGSPNKADRLASFEGWSDVVRSAIVWLGRADPVDSQKEARADDPKRLEHDAVLAQWARVIGIGEQYAVPLSHVLELCDEDDQYGNKKYPEFVEAISRVASRYGRPPTQHYLEYWARGIKGKKGDGNMKLVNHKSKGRAARWWVQLGNDPYAGGPGLDSQSPDNPVRF